MTSLSGAGQREGKEAQSAHCWTTSNTLHANKGHTKDRELCAPITAQLKNSKMLLA